MNQIKELLKNWNAARVIRMILAGLLGAAYFSNKEPLYLFGALMLSVQAIFNISCAGGSCGTGYSKSDKPLIKTEKYEPKK
jgi:hypothetical protein